MMNFFFLGIIPIGDYHTAVPYTPQEEDMVLQSTDINPVNPELPKKPIDFQNQLEAYSKVPKSIQSYSIAGDQVSQDGLEYVYEISGSKLVIHVDISSYNIVTYSFEEGEYESVMVAGTEQSSVYGSPVAPYKNLLISIPENAHVTNVDVISTKSELISQLELVPGPKPVAIYEDYDANPKLFFNPDIYNQDCQLNSELIDYRIVEQGNEDGLFLTVHPLQYNPSKKQGMLSHEIVIEVQFDTPVTLQDLTFNGGVEPNSNYTIIIKPGFESATASFVWWKTQLGFNVEVVTLEDIYTTYPGYDHPEMIRNFINAAYTENNTSYIFLIGDGDIVPVREVVDPYWGPGIDNGTEPSDLYYECLDGSWDLNGNHQYGELDDNVDFFPEVMVGRIPVQTPQEAEDVLGLIAQYEMSLAVGDWIYDFMLIGNDCFGIGDGPGMLEGVLNQKYLYDSFFDVSRFYSTDGSLTTSNVVSAINSGVGIVDFFDHGAYDQWYGTLTVPDVLGLTNTDVAMFAFAMACETAAFDYEIGEPVIGEAFFRNSNGGAAAYIGATRVAWASAEAFDGFHNVFWDNFMKQAIAEREASPKKAFQEALNHMVVSYDMSSPVTLETVYQAIYFGDPSMNMYWKNNFTTTASAVDVHETVELNVTCQTYNNQPLSGAHAVVNVIDPMGNIVTSSPITTDVNGTYSLTFETSNRPGNYRVETSVTDPFAYTSESSFNVGSVDVTLQLDNNPIYHTFLQFSGTANADCVGNASLIDSSGSVIQSSAFTVSGGVFSSSLNITSFGDLRLYIILDNGSSFGGVETSFRLNRADILVISDDTGWDMIDYPGGWADDNVGDSSNPVDFASALKDEYNVTVFYPLYDIAPTLSYLNEFDGVIVTTGDNIGFPLNSPTSYLLDMLNEYHQTGGNLLFEGSYILSALNGTEDLRFSNLFHLEYLEYTINSGSLELVKSSHPIMSGLPSSIPLADGLGTVVADVFNPSNGSLQAAAYGGSYIGGTAISGFSPTSGLGGVVFIGFSIDAITNKATRDLLISNAAAFLLQPSLMVSLSDDAMQTGSTETIYFEVTDAATETPIPNAEVAVYGCGVVDSNTTQPDGTCSIFFNPTFEGAISINVTKGGYLNFSTNIIVYDLPIVALRASPSFLEPYKTQVVTITAKDYYERFPLYNCYINATGLGNSVDSYTNTSGMVDITLTPNNGGLINVNGSLAGYLDSSIGIPVKLNVVVLPGMGIDMSDYFIWDELEFNWDDYGTMPLSIDYTTFASEAVTLEKLEELNPAALYLAYPVVEYTQSMIDAIMAYVEQGHGFILGSTALYLNSEWAPFFGLADDMEMDAPYIDTLTLNLENSSHPLFEGVSDPYTPAFGGTICPYPSLWDGSVLRGATYLARDGEGYAAILTYRGMVYFSFLPEYQGYTDDCQLAYNAIIWSEYKIPDHDLSLSLEAPEQSNPSETVLLNATVYNKGLYNETGVTVRLFIDEVQVDSLTIPLLENGDSALLQSSWTPTVETLYNVTAIVDPVPGEATYINNILTQIVSIKFLKDYIMLEGTYDWYDAVANGVNLHVTGDDVYTVVPLPFTFPYYDEIFETAYVSSNGWLSFTNMYPYEYSNPDFPSDDPEYSYCIAPLWDDLQASDNIYLWSTADMVVIQFNNYELLGGSDVGTFQVVLHASGLIEFNYLIVYTVYSATIGLNHGDGIHFNSYPDSSIIGSTEFGLQFTYVTPEHDLSASMIAPERAWVDVPVDITAVAFNAGNHTEHNFHLALYFNGDLVDSVFISSLAPFSSESFVYEWTPSSPGYYNFTVFVDLVPGEYSTTNNARTRLILVEEPREFVILSPVEDEVVSGGTILIEYDAASLDTLIYIDVFVNDIYTLSVPHLERNEFMVPVFQNGTNEISVIALWEDMTTIGASVSFESVNVIPLLEPQPGDYYIWVYDYGTDRYEMNYTFHDMDSEYVVEVELVETWYQDDIPQSSYYSTLYVNILNGYITFMSTNYNGAHLFFMSCLDSPSNTGTIAEIGDCVVMHDWVDIYAISSFTIWNGYAVWILTNLEYGNQIQVFRNNGIVANDAPYGEIVDTSFFPEIDTSPPIWITEPHDIYVEAGEDLEYQFEVFDESGLNSFTVNNSLFRLTLNGLLTNRVPLDVGYYGLELTATDPFSHSLVGSLAVIVEDTTPPHWIDYHETITINVGDALQLRLLAEDFSGIDHYSVNDTRFTMSADGWLTSVIQLKAGMYPLFVSVYDIYGNVNTMALQIIVQPSGVLPPTMFLVLFVGVFIAIAVIGFIGLLLIRKRMHGSR